MASDSTELQDDQIVIVCASDDNYAMPLSATICSVLANLEENRLVNLFIIDGGIRKNNKNKILKSISSKHCRVEWIEKPDKLFQGVKLVTSHMGYITVAAYYRLLIAEILPKKFQKVIYLDTDLIIKKDLSQLWDADLGDYFGLAVQDYVAPYVSSANGLLNYQELGIPSDCKYFNSGVMVINLEKWRTSKIFDRSIRYLEENSHMIRWCDQDVLNALFMGNWGELDPRWNQLSVICNYSSWEDSPFSRSVYENIINEPYIIHYTPNKPWNSPEKNSRNNNFFYYLDMTAWIGWRPNLWHRLERKLIKGLQKIIQKLRKPNI